VTCSYGKRHGICDSPVSDFNRIRSIISSYVFGEDDDYDMYKVKNTYSTKLGMLNTWDAQSVYKELINKIISEEITRDNVWDWV
jgi:hypothetical protein